MDEAACYDLLREIRWEDGVSCPNCQSKEVVKNGYDDNYPQLLISFISLFYPPHRLQARPFVLSQAFPLVF